jgi:hypothetical protein
VGVVTVIAVVEGVDAETLGGSVADGDGDATCCPVVEADPGADVADCDPQPVLINISGISANSRTLTFTLSTYGTKVAQTGSNVPFRAEYLVGKCVLSVRTVCLEGTHF